MGVICTSQFWATQAVHFIRDWRNKLHLSDSKYQHVKLDLLETLHPCSCIHLKDQWEHKILFLEYFHFYCIYNINAILVNKDGSAHCRSVSSHYLPSSTQNQNISFSRSGIFQLHVRIWKLQGKIIWRSDHFLALNRINIKPIALFIHIFYQKSFFFLQCLALENLDI